MATSQDKAQKFKEAFRGKGPQIFMGAMALLLVARIFLFMQESGFQNTNPAQPQVITNIPDAVQPDVQNKVNQMLNPLPDFTTTTFYALAQVNMFDAKAAQNAEALVNRANQFVVQAQGAYDRKNWNEAQTMLKEALRVNPSQPNALALRDKVEAALAAAATSATLAQQAGQPTLPDQPAPGAPGGTGPAATPGVPGAPAAH